MITPVIKQSIIGQSYFLFEFGISQTFGAKTAKIDGRNAEDFLMSDYDFRKETNEAESGILRCKKGGTCPSSFREKEFSLQL